MHRASFLSGARAVLPVLPGMVPFGLITGVAATRVGLSVLEAMSMSVFVYAGAAQLAALELMRNDAPLLIVVSTLLVVNLRLTMYSASLAPYFERLSWRWRGIVGYNLVDPIYAISIVRFGENEATDGPRDSTRRASYFVGAATPLWVVWQIATLVGVFLGARIPVGWHLEFAFPLVFLALVFPGITDRATAAAAGVAALVAVLGEPLPLDLGIVVAATAGIAAGLVVEWGDAR